MPPRKRPKSLLCEIPLDHLPSSMNASQQGVEDIHVHGWSKQSEGTGCPLDNINSGKVQRIQFVRNTKSRPGTIKQSHQPSQQPATGTICKQPLAQPDCHAHKREGRLVVTFLQGPLAHGMTDGHPRHEGQTARRVRDLGNSWGRATRISKSAIKVCVCVCVFPLRKILWCVSAPLLDRGKI